VRLHYVEVAPPVLASPRGALARLEEALTREWGLTGLDADLHVVRALQPALEAGDHRVTVAVHDARTITAVWPGFHDRAFGIAIDVGSTTIAGHLADLRDGTILASAGTMNPQIRFGEDLMSRVSYAMLHEGGAAEMTRAVRSALAKLASGLASDARVATRDVLEVTLVGNPIMHHLVLGIDPVPLGSAPFALATDQAVRTTAAELGIRAHPGARAYLLPCIAGHVGADTAGVILAEQPHRDAEAVRLVVDVGTNAEIVLGNRDRLLAASSPTGPAFEGAQISAGQRAAPGAIERVRIDRATLEPRFRVIGVDAWSDEPAFTGAVARTGVTGICGSGIVEAIAELFLAGVVTADGVIDGGLAARTARIVPDGRTFSYVLHDGEPSVVVTQNDVRAIQLAKAALYAGARLLMDRLGIETVDEIRLAGAFDGPRPHPGLPARSRSRGRQRRGERCIDRAPFGCGTARGRGGRTVRREGRDGGRAALPGPLRRGPRHSAPVGAVDESRADRGPSSPAVPGRRGCQPPSRTAAPKGGAQRREEVERWMNPPAVVAAAAPPAWHNASPHMAPASRS
jgi:uncharacterized 2Fe-2S/4Fe-4S cluster protein (DUF4445 family)